MTSAIRTARRVILGLALLSSMVVGLSGVAPAAHADDGLAPTIQATVGAYSDGSGFYFVVTGQHFTPSGDVLVKVQKEDIVKVDEYYTVITGSTLIDSRHITASLPPHCISYFSPVTWTMETYCFDPNPGDIIYKLNVGPWGPDGCGWWWDHYDIQAFDTGSGRWSNEERVSCSVTV